MSPRKGVGFALGPFGLRTWTGFDGGWDNKGYSPIFSTKLSDPTLWR